MAPQPMHRPGRFMFQFLAMGRHGKSASMKNVKPHSVQITIIPQMRRLARRYPLEVVDGAVSANRRKYWRRMASLIRVALAQYAALVE